MKELPRNHYGVYNSRTNRNICFALTNENNIWDFKAQLE